MVDIHNIVSDEFLDEKALEIGNSLIVENTTYCQLLNKSVVLFNSIKDNLPASCQSLIADYEKTHLLMQDIALEEAFRHGVKETTTQVTNLLTSLQV